MPMDRNSEAHFSQVPSIDIPRSRFDRSHSVKFTFNAGLLIPFLCDPVYPGDTVELETSKVIRMQTLATPLMDDLFCDVYYFYCPNRLVWDHWKEFCGENTQSAWIPQVEYSIPTVNVRRTLVGGLADYFGLPVGVQNDILVNSLPFRIYFLIWDQYFRDQNIQDPIQHVKSDSNVAWVDVLNRPYNTNDPMPVCKTHDYFTSCLPAPQKGPAVSLPIGDSAPVSMTDHVTAVPQYPLVFGSPQSVLGRDTGWVFNGGANIDGTNASISLNSNTSNIIPLQTYESITQLGPSNLFADLSGATSITVNDLRLAFQTQKFYEQAARGGTRYRELLKSFFGVTNGDSRMQIPEYLGGNRIPISIHQVTNTSSAGTDPLGDVAGMSVTNDVHHDFIHSFTEHGFLIGLCCVRYEHTYAQGAERFWFDKSKFDLYWPVFAHLGEQPVFKREIYTTGTSTDNDVLGYQEAWAYLRYKNNSVRGEMRPGVTNSLASWNLSDYYASVPTLSSDWIKEDKSPIDRALAVQSNVAHQFLADFYVNAKWTRAMPLYSVPGLIDHF